MKEEYNIYPLVIISDRYGGVYSGAEWIACNIDEICIPREISGGDSECMDFWDDYRDDKTDYTNRIGLGDTIQQAIQDLLTKYENLK